MFKYILINRTQDVEAETSATAMYKDEETSYVIILNRILNLLSNSTSFFRLIQMNLLMML